MKQPIVARANCRCISFDPKAGGALVYAYATRVNINAVAGRDIHLTLSVDEAEDLASLLNSFVAQRKAQADEQ